MKLSKHVKCFDAFDHHYKIVQLDNDSYYLVDIRSILGKIFPFISYFIPHKAYKISKEDYKKYRRKDHPSNDSSLKNDLFLAFIGSGIGAWLANLIPVYGLHSKFLLLLEILIPIIVANMLIHFLANKTGKINYRELENKDSKLTLILIPDDIKVICDMYFCVVFISLGMYWLIQIIWSGSINFWWIAGLLASSLAYFATYIVMYAWTDSGFLLEF
ncbi:DUF443 family protein [Ligilactobacillus aviarius]|uniref:DUF443 family protein n=1 Tax=Ligilactobacillus aviarius TaxID=1606 RepID=UPI0024B9D776|nr:DUF443 family protein [Ligilactobacillus aviarius]